MSGSAFGNGSGGGVGTVVAVGSGVVEDTVIVANGVWAAEPVIPDNFGSTTKYTPAMTTKITIAPMIANIFLVGGDFFGDTTIGIGGGIPTACSSGNGGDCRGCGDGTTVDGGGGTNEGGGGGGDKGDGGAGESSTGAPQYLQNF